MEKLKVKLENCYGIKKLEHEFDNGVVGCKQAPCEEFCASKGYDKGEWAKYTGEYGWDSCYCSD